MYREMAMTYSGWGRRRLKRANSNRQSAMAAARQVVLFQASKKVLVPSPWLPDLAQGRSPFAAQEFVRYLRNFCRADLTTGANSTTYLAPNCGS
jgi:hypothetical protein